MAGDGEWVGGISSVGLCSGVSVGAGRSVGVEGGISSVGLCSGVVEEIGTLGGLGAGAVAVDGGASVWLIADALSGGGDTLKPGGLPRFSRCAGGGAFGLKTSRGGAGTVWLIARGGGGAGAVWLIADVEALREERDLFKGPSGGARGC